MRRRQVRGKLNRLEAREAAVWRGADGYVTITAGLKRTLEEKFGSRATAPSFLTASDRAPSLASAPPPGGVPVVAYAGHLYPWKGVDILLDAVARTPGIAAVIVGGHDAEGDRARLESRCGGSSASASA